ncbi:hypothetical protein [Ottowia sp. oral taxon 894]|uniref:hypothetical protein n=1 Tax=Ottowia sp. oral taxon 894 TaxID=1658672 RepID=UPI0012E14782|nr:hypothetical protein [Ottowia sp. oral taxon 894]
MFFDEKEWAMKPLKTLNSYPEGSLMNPAFCYVRSAETDVRKTFERIRQAQAAQPALALGRRAGRMGSANRMEQMDLLGAVA